MLKVSKPQKEPEREIFDLDRSDRKQECKPPRKIRVRFFDMVSECFKGKGFVEIEISDDVYEIVSAKGLRQFENLYGVPMGGGMLQIDWKKVQDDGWAGIQICPYRGEARYSSMWYYGWDVASGCIWDPAGLTSFKLLGTRGDEE